MTDALIAWLRSACDTYKVLPYAIFRKESAQDPSWPLQASSADELAGALAMRGHFLPLPQEPAALANILEVSVVDHLLDQASTLADSVARRGGERGYPDLEIGAAAFGPGTYAVDVKVARRSKSKKQTDSRITLYTGNTYFRYPELKWPSTLRTFSSYSDHLTLMVLYTLDTATLSRVTDVEVIIQETWRIASKQRSSTTREYIGAVLDIDSLREGRGEFASRDDFYRFWRAYPFKTGKTVERQLQRLIAELAKSQ